jgi:general stress protein YciG
METTMANQQHSGGGGRNNPGNFANDREKAREAGRAGGTHQGKDTNPGNFANDRQKAAEAGRKGGQHSHGGHGGAHKGETKGTET